MHFTADVGIVVRPLRRVMFLRDFRTTMLPLNENLDARAFWELWVPEPAVLTWVLAPEAEQ
jgi:hypothetical protein